MTNFIPIFPLSLVVYPREVLKLHVFESRYKQLIRDCVAEGKPFGIPGVIDKKLNDYGTLMEITRVEKEYENGEMDIVVKGVRVFRVLEVVREIPDKLYIGAIVHYPPNKHQGNPRLMKSIVEGVRTLHNLMNLSKDFTKPDEALSSYDVAHETGLSLEEEYEMLMLMHERQRQEYLRRHLRKVIPILVSLEQLKERAKQNGHFRELFSSDF